MIALHGVLSPPFSLVFPATSAEGLLRLARQTGENFGVNLPDLVAQGISFAILALLLRQFAFKPMMRAIEARRAHIAATMVEAENVRQQVAKTEAARQEILHAAHAEAERIIEDARAAGRALLATEKLQAHATAEDILAKARHEAALEGARLRSEIRRETAALVVDATVAVTGKVLTVEDHERLRQEALSYLAA